MNGSRKPSQTDTEGDAGIETKVRKNCSHPLLDLGTWQHKEQMKTEQHALRPYCEAEVEMSIFPYSPKLT